MSARIQIIQNSFIIIIAIFVLTFKFNVYVYAMIQSCVSILILIVYIIITPVNFIFSIANTKKLVCGSILFGLSSLLYIIYFKIDTVMLSLFKGTYEVGIYESAYKVINIIISMIAILDNIVMPKFFKLYKNNKNKMIDIFEVLLKNGVVFGIPISVVLMFLSKYIINILYGKAYSDSIVILQILVWTICIRLMAVITGFVITASDNMYKKVKFQFGFAIFNVGLNSFLIPNYGVKGAALSSIITEFMVFMIYFIFVKRNFKVTVKSSYILKSILANILLIVILRLFDNTNFIFMSIISGCAYILTIRVFFKSELYIAIKLVSSAWKTTVKND